MPGTNGDAIRAIESLPGVARPPGLDGSIIVRGSAPQDTQVFVDGALIPLAYHFGGVSSVVPSEILDRLELRPGNFGSEYGRGMGRRGRPRHSQPAPRPPRRFASGRRDRRPLSLRRPDR
ncbi:MAG: Plug domain-containing protein [Sandaracinus sp.]|nr:Plug domain-containing protein [Sandaracinus sp.]